MPSLWSGISRKAKADIKDWFIQRAEKVGVEWTKSLDFAQTNMAKLQSFASEIEEGNTEYPEYYLKSFHSYENGNLGWEAAVECLPATLSMSVGYWKGKDPELQQAWLRGNYSASVDAYIDEHSPNLMQPRSAASGGAPKVLDVGCSIGASTKFLLDAYPQSDVLALDLSPNFLAMAKLNLENKDGPLYTPAHDQVQFIHGKAEDTKLPDNSLDMVSISFVFHEVPDEVNSAIVKEAYRVLKPGGVLSIIDLNKQVLQKLPQPRKYFFEITEPHVKDFYQFDMQTELQRAGFDSVVCHSNDPMNAVCIGHKSWSSISL